MLYMYAFQWTVCGLCHKQILSCVDYFNVNVEQRSCKLKIEVYINTDRETDRQIDRWIERWMDRWTERETDRQTDAWYECH